MWCEKYDRVRGMGSNLWIAEALSRTAMNLHVAVAWFQVALRSFLLPAVGLKSVVLHSWEQTRKCACSP